MALTPTVEICVVGALSVLALAAGIWLGRRLERARPCLLAGSLVGALVYAWAFSGRLGWAAWLPFGTVALWANMMPALLSLSAGLACRTSRLPGWRRPVSIGLLSILAMAYIVAPLIRPVLAPLQLSSAQWRQGICLQSHSSSCAPAAAATLLRLHGIDATERELSRVCLTSRQGTEPLSLFRGLNVASRHSRIGPAVASADARSWVELEQLPNIALVQFERMGPRRPLDRLLGPRGEGHAVVVLGRTSDNHWSIADPAFGKTVWTDEQFQQRFTGDALYLTNR
jgi:hypothetical protein